MASPAQNEALSADIEQKFSKFLATLGNGGGDMLEQITVAMRKKLATPPCKDLEDVLGRPISEDEARQLLFWPSEEDMKLYPQLLADAPGTTGASSGSVEALQEQMQAQQQHPQGRMQVLATSLLYLTHGLNWDTLKPFIEAGGLRSLVDLIGHPNFYLASQGMQTLLAATDDELFPWHVASSNPWEGPDAHLFQRMLELASSPLVPNLLRHQGPDTFPGSGIMGLRALAFFASWLRYHCTPDRVLRLSPRLLALIGDWAHRDGASEAEKQLAGQLHADFGRFTPETASDAPQFGIGPDDCINLNPGREQLVAWHQQRLQAKAASAAAASAAEQEAKAKAEAGDGARLTADRTQVNSGSSSPYLAQIEALRQKGNEAYKKGDYGAAIAAYSAALDAPVPAEAMVTEGQRRALLLSNRAAAYLARAAAGGGKPGDLDDVGALEGVSLGTPEALTMHYRAALLDAQLALDLDEGGASSVKLVYRMAQALQGLQHWEEAEAAAQAAVERAKEASGATKQVMMREAQQLLQNIREQKQKLEKQAEEKQPQEEKPAQQQAAADALADQAAGVDLGKMD